YAIPSGAEEKTDCGKVDRDRRPSHELSAHMVLLKRNLTYAHETALERVCVPLSIVTDAVQKQTRSAVHSVLNPCQEITADSFLVRFVLQLMPKAVDIQSKLLCVANQIFRPESLLPLEQQSVHFPESALSP